MADEGNTSPSLSSLFPTGSSGSMPSVEKKEEKDTSSVPVTDKSNTDEEAKAKAKADPLKKVPVDKKVQDTTPKKDQPKVESKEGDQKDKSAEKKSAIDAKAAGNTDDKSDSTKVGDDKGDTPKDDPFEKRWKDTQAWATKINQEKLQLAEGHKQLKQQVDILTKKLADPDYDPKTDPAYAGPTHEEVAATSLMAGKALASRNSAYREHGQEKVDAIVDQFVSLFQDNEAVQTAVRNSENPIHAAMDIVEDYHFRSKYGNRPSDIIKSIRDEHEVNLRKTIRAEIIEEIRGGKELKERSAKGLSDIRGGNGADDSKTKGEKGITPLSRIFTSIK